MNESEMSLDVATLALRGAGGCFTRQRLANLATAMLSVAPGSETPAQTPERHRQGTTGGGFDRLQGQPAARRAWPGWAGAAHLRPTRSAGTDPLSVPAATQTIPAPALHWPGSRRRALRQLRAEAGLARQDCSQEACTTCQS